ncbi:hypothetical protein [Angustibacter aerolatus]
MLFALVQRTWPEVQAGRLTAEESVLGDWAALAEAKLHQYGDAIVGVAAGRVVAAYDITGWERVQDDRVRFQGTPSSRWAHLVGSASPVVWTRGQARPIRYFDTAALADDEPRRPSPSHRDRVDLHGWTLQLAQDGTAVLHMPPGGRVTVVTEPA